MYDVFDEGDIALPGITQTSIDHHDQDEHGQGHKEDIELLGPTCLLYEARCLRQGHNLIVEANAHRQKYHGVDQGE